MIFSVNLNTKLVAIRERALSLSVLLRGIFLFPFHRFPLIRRPLFASWTTSFPTSLREWLYDIQFSTPSLWHWLDWFLDYRRRSLRQFSDCTSRVWSRRLNFHRHLHSSFVQGKTRDLITTELLAPHKNVQQTLLQNSSPLYCFPSRPAWVICQAPIIPSISNTENKGVSKT